MSRNYIAKRFVADCSQAILGEFSGYCGLHNKVKGFSRNEVLTFLTIFQPPLISLDFPWFHKQTGEDLMCLSMHHYSKYLKRLKKDQADHTAIATQPPVQLVRLPDQVLVINKLQMCSSHELSDSDGEWTSSSSLPCAGAMSSSICKLWICPRPGQTQEGNHFVQGCICNVNANSF